MENKFSIGEISKLFKIPIKTLRYYDEIGLFKPMDVNKDTGYRYYSTEQFEHLHTIIYLKILGMPLKLIKSHLEYRDINVFLELLKKHQKLTEIKINELEEISKKFEGRIIEIEEAKNIQKLECVMVKSIPERNILRLKEKICSEAELELSLKKLDSKTNANFDIIIGKVGLTISMDHIKQMCFNEYNSIFVLLEKDFIQHEDVEKIPQGDYACIYYRGNHHASPKYYKMILAYLEKNNHDIIGDSIERTIINQFISIDKKHHLTEIQIPIK